MSLLSHVELVIPSLTSELYKGLCGRIGILGGSAEYTGAPYLAAMAALRTGADIAHIFCVQSAGTAIKSFSPDIVVHPVLPDSGSTAQSETDAVEYISQLLPRIHSLVIGPGLGRDEMTLKCVASVIERARLRSLPLVIDADGLHLIITQPSLIDEYPCVILTPNAAEVC